MTGPSTFSSLLTTERPAINLPRDVAGLQAECKKRNLPTTGSKAELTDRLSAHETVNSRAYSTTRASRPSLPSTSSTSASIPTRHFNTSRTLKAVNDSSTIDFAYLPDFDPDISFAPVPVMRVPLLPSDVYTGSSIPTYATAEAEHTVMKPEIVTVSADSTHIHAPSAMSEVSDNGSVDFQGMAEKVAQRLGKTTAEVAGKGSMARQVWGGMVDDLFGPKGSGRPTA